MRPCYHTISKMCVCCSLPGGTEGCVLWEHLGKWSIGQAPCHLGRHHCSSCSRWTWAWTLPPCWALFCTWKTESRVFNRDIKTPECRQATHVSCCRINRAKGRVICKSCVKKKTFTTASSKYKSLIDTPICFSFGIQENNDTLSCKNALLKIIKGSKHNPFNVFGNGHKENFFKKEIKNKHTHSFSLTRLLLLCNYNPFAVSRSHISPLNSQLPLGHSNAAASATWTNCTMKQNDINVKAITKISSGTLKESKSYFPRS